MNMINLFRSHKHYWAMPRKRSNGQNVQICYGCGKEHTVTMLFDFYAGDAASETMVVNALYASEMVEINVIRPAYHQQGSALQTRAINEGIRKFREQSNCSVRGDGGKELHPGENKMIKLSACLAVLLILVFVLCPLSLARVGHGKMTDQISQSKKAATVFREIMNTPDKGIPRDLLNKAECIAVFPSVLKAGFVFGGQGGRGVASCRTHDGWSAPLFLNLKGGSVGLQIGAQSTDFVLLFMNDDGLKSLLSDKFELGADASVAAGPVGRQAGASTDLKLTSEILSYSRSRGLFGGLELKGVVITQDKDDNRGVYGDDVTSSQVLRENKVNVPDSLRTFPRALGRYSGPVAAK
ncbi:MAG TPA: lipid-binding SYLF domain-containing protein [Blastocatellia bacterium]|nr:lipid-binding SYLF domain-containing protein [Blastocatellia bacterium]